MYFKLISVSVGAQHNQVTKCPSSSKTRNVSHTAQHPVLFRNHIPQTLKKCDPVVFTSRQHNDHVSFVWGKNVFSYT